jgi:hypothetical protein
MHDRDESRRQIARRKQRTAGDRSARLANALMKLPTPALGKVALDEEIREAVASPRPASRSGATCSSRREISTTRPGRRPHRLADRGRAADRRRGVFVDGDRHLAPPR